MKRSPAVAGQFYQGIAEKLKKQVEQLTDGGTIKEHAIGILSPHAGLIYSGSVAGLVYSSIIFPETFILIGPNHTGLGADVSLMPSGEWEIPTGVFSIDEELSERILKNSKTASRDSQAHIFEHSLEVQLPFIAHFPPSAKIVPVTMMQISLGECREFGEAIAKSVKQAGYPVVIVASSDMSHYVTDAAARRKDRMAIDRIIALDPEGLYEVIIKERISMCGYIPAAVMLFASKALGAYESKLVKYTTSAETSGDYDHVVGYAGMIVK